VGYIDKNYRRKRVHEKEPVVRSHRRLDLGLKVDTHSLTTKILWNVARTSPHRMFDEMPAQIFSFAFSFRLIYPVTLNYANYLHIYISCVFNPRIACI
jgi:hypothetical protein